MVHYLSMRRFTKQGAGHSHAPEHVSSRFLHALNKIVCGGALNFKHSASADSARVDSHGRLTVHVEFNYL